MKQHHGLPPETGSLRLAHPKGEGGANSRIHGVSTRFKNRYARPRRFKMGGGHHAQTARGDALGLRHFHPCGLHEIGVHAFDFFLMGSFFPFL
jgi:hypothetical protein